MFQLLHTRHSRSSSGSSPAHKSTRSGLAQLWKDGHSLALIVSRRSQPDNAHSHDDDDADDEEEQVSEVSAASAAPLDGEKLSAAERCARRRSR
jgi:hypothetical protein